MAVLRLTFLITDLHLGGSPLMLRGLAAGLHSLNNGQDFEVSIISLKPLPPQDQSAMGDLSSTLPIHSLNLTSPLQLFRARRDLVEILRHNKAEILYSILIHANILAALAVPRLDPRPVFIQSIHTLQPRPRWHWSIQRFIAPHADAIVAPSQPILDRIARYGRIKQGLVIPNGIDVDRFACAEAIAPAQRPWPAGARVVGCVGRFDPVKRLDILLYTLKYLHDSSNSRAEIAPGRKDVAARPGGVAAGGCRGGVGGVSGGYRGGDGKDVFRENTPDWHLALVGYGPDEKRLRDLTTTLHLTPFVHFLGRTRAPEQFYKSFNCLCLPSIIEGFGLVLAEALAAGIPVVAPQTPVIEALIRPTDGKLVPSPTPESLAQVIKEVTENPPDSKSLQTHIRTHFSTALMIERHAEFFRKMQNISSLRDHNS